jgi:hypothetical protein
MYTHYLAAPAWTAPLKLGDLDDRERLQISEMQKFHVYLTITSIKSNNSPTVVDAIYLKPLSLRLP